MSTDSRVKYTKMILRKSLLTLMKLKPFEKITVKELCETAEINRGTFYLHYGSPYELLKNIENEFINENMKIFDNYWQDGHDNNMMVKLFTCIHENRDLCEVLMGRNGDPSFLETFKNFAHDGTVKEWLKEFPDYPCNDLEFLFSYVFSGSMQLILDWIHNDYDISPSEFTQRLERLGHYNLLAIREFNI